MYKYLGINRYREKEEEGSVTYWPVVIEVGEFVGQSLYVIGLQS